VGNVSLLALFGYPVAQENDAERAVRAALAIQRSLTELNRKNDGTGKPALAARVAIEPGPVVVDASGEIFGDIPNIAARAQALAEAGAVVVTARVQRQVAGLFVAEERGNHQLKGVPEPVTLLPCRLSPSPLPRQHQDMLQLGRAIPRHRAARQCRSSPPDRRTSP
jgi:class 3 adenylate cyclase